MRIWSKYGIVPSRHRLLGRASLIAAALLGFSALVGISGGPAFAALSITGGACGFHLGGALQEGAAGSIGFEFPVYPASPQQVCDVTVTASVSLRTASGGAYTNVDDDPSSKTLVLQFAGGPLPLGILAEWTPYCSDPPVPGVFTLTVDGQASSTADRKSVV